MGFATIEEQDKQLGALVREKESLERAAAELKERVEDARGRGNEVQALWLEGRVAESERALKANAQQMELVSGSAKTRGRAQRR